MNWAYPLCAFALAFTTLSSAFADEVVPVTTGESFGETTAADPDAFYVEITEPAYGAQFAGNPNATVSVTAEFTGAATTVAIQVGDTDIIDCPIVDVGLCKVDIELPPGVHTLQARLNEGEGPGQWSSLIDVEVTVEGATSGGDSSGGDSSGGDSSGGDSSGGDSSGGGGSSEGPTSGGDGSGGGSSGGSSGDTESAGGGSGDADTNKGCACDVRRSGGPASAVLMLGGFALAWRRRAR